MTLHQPTVLLVFTLLFAACTAPVSPKSSSIATQSALPTTLGIAANQPLMVFAPASLTEAFTELAKGFVAKHPQAKVSFNFAGSQQLAQQLAQGAPADVFASADRAQMNAAIQARRIAANQLQALAGNKLVVVLASSNPGRLRQLSDLADPGIKLILADKSVPAGNYSLEFLDKASKNLDFGSGFREAVLNNVVSYEENVRAVLTKVSLGEADAGIVYSSDITKKVNNRMGVMEIPPDLNVNALYFIAPVQDSQQASLAHAFIAYALSSEGQELLAKFGFETAH
jgi:molybdate transport system substrate-binding protein